MVGAESEMERRRIDTKECGVVEEEEIIIKKLSKQSMIANSWHKKASSNWNWH